MFPEPVQRGETHLSEREKHICLDPGHDAGNLANKSPDGTYYEHVFTLDLGKRLEKLLTPGRLRDHDPYWRRGSKPGQTV